MTISEFITELKKVSNKFHWSLKRWPDVTKSDGIRAKAKDNLDFIGCPITSLLYIKKGKDKPTCTYMEAGILLGLERDDIDTIACSADGTKYKDYYSENIRRELLKAVGLDVEDSGMVEWSM